MIGIFTGDQNGPTSEEQRRALMEPILRQMSELISHSPLDVSVIREETEGLHEFSKQECLNWQMKLIHVLVYHEPNLYQLPSEARLFALEQRMGLFFCLISAWKKSLNTPTDAMSVPPDIGSSQAITSEMPIDETIQGE